jgi:hypothetical protein
MDRLLQQRFVLEFSCLWIRGLTAWDHVLSWEWMRHLNTIKLWARRVFVLLGAVDWIAVIWNAQEK